MVKPVGRKTTKPAGTTTEPLLQIPQQVVAAEIAGSEKAKNEVDVVDSGKSAEEVTADEKGRLAEARRQQTFLGHFEWVNIIAMWCIAGAMAILGIVWLLHMVLPAKCSGYLPVCRWLEPDEVVVIQDILTGGLIAGLVADHFRRRLNFNKKADGK